MKKYLIIIGVFAIISSCNNSKDKIPKEVKAIFESEFPNIQNPDWEVEGEYYEVEAIIDGNNTSIVYDAKGNIVLKETACKLEELPSSIMDYLQQNYIGAFLNEVEKGESTEKGNFFKVEIIQDKKEIELIFDNNGTFKEAKEEIVEDDEVDDDSGLNMIIEAAKEENKNANDVNTELLPKLVSKYVEESYKGFIITDAELEKTEEGDFYKVEIKNSERSVNYLIFDLDGNFIKTETDDQSS